jgi:dihydrofolate reductase
MTVDGVVSVSDWYVSEGEHNQAARDVFARSSVMVLGRKTYEGLAAYWTEQEGPWADVINPMPKAVASRSLDESELAWNATLIDGDGVAGVGRLKDEVEGDLVLVGCGELARQLIDARLVDEAWFWVHPAVWGEGERPLGNDVRLRLQLVEAKNFDSGVTLLRYRP